MSDSDKSQPVKTSRFRRWFGWKFWIGLCVLVGILFWFHVPSRLINSHAETLLREYKLDRAERWLRTSLKLGESFPETHFLLARTFRKQGEGQLMLDELEQFVELGGETEKAAKEELLYSAQAGDLRGRYQQMDQMLIDQTGDEREILEAYVNGLLINVRFKEAKVVIEEWIKAFPDDPLPHYARGRIEVYFRNRDASEREFRDALKKQPDHDRSLFGLAGTLLANNNPEQAMPYYTRCFEMPHSAAPRIGYAKCLLQMGRLEEAKQEMLAVTKLSDTERKTSYRRLGEQYVGRPDAALLAEIEMSLGNLEKSIEWYDVAIEADSTDLDIRYARALVLRELGRTEEAQEEIVAVNESRAKLREVDAIQDKMDTFAPEVESRLKIGEIYLEHGSKQTAEFWLKSVLAFEPDNTEAHRLLADYYRELSQTNERYRDQAKFHQQQATRSASSK